MRYLTKVRRFILKIKENAMVVVDIGYRKLVMPKEKALLLAEILETSEVYEDKYWSESQRKEKGMTESYTYHVYTDPKESYSMKIISDQMYQMAKLAGKPTKE